MEKNNETMIPYIVYESMLSKEDTQQKRMIAVIILLIVLLLVTNVIWIVAWNQYDYVDDYTADVSAEQDGAGVNIIGGRDVDYGTESNDKDTQSEDEGTP